MNEGQYTNIRTYLESIDSKLGRLIAEQQRTNELLAQQFMTAEERAIREEHLRHNAIEKQIAGYINQISRDIQIAEYKRKESELISPVGDGNNAEAVKPKRGKKEAE